jgi:hypothetical protein
MPANHVFTPWTNAREMELIVLWGQEFSAQTIALKLGGVSRNAVLGKVFRLRLPKRTNRNRHFYTAPCDRHPPKRPVNKSVFPTREQKPAFHIPNPNFKPALTSVTSKLTGAIISIKRRPRVPEMTKPELRAMLTQAMVNTGGVLQ